ncbi:hypothetical protein H0Z60_05965 [Ectothiorhodospiraceae bacterium WFHF3C12]|nr:hypothetical protein [Ectothiorhodospiraceae bacterium WFHF3C12]
MTRWHALNLGDAMLADPELQRLERAFELAYGADHDAGEKALFLRHESEGRLHCEVLVYFTPATRELAREMHARPCAPPAPQGLELVKGDSAAWALFEREESR